MNLYITKCFILICLPASNVIVKLFKISDSVVFKIIILGSEILNLTYSSNFLEVATPKGVGKFSYN